MKNWLATSENNSNASAEIASQDSQEVQETVQITTFADNLAVIPEHAPGEMTLPSFGVDQFTDEMVHSVISFLERPQLLQSFYWDPTSKNLLNSDLLFSKRGSTDPADVGLMIPSQVFHTMQLKKLDGFAGFRATAVFKLQVNSQPFVAGRLIMAALPMPALLQDRGRYATASMANLQNLNHVQMDVCKQTEVELRVPFISPYNCYDLTTYNFDWAQLFIRVYGPLNTTQTGKIECVLWAHFEDIKLGFPTTVQNRKYNNSIIEGALVLPPHIKAQQQGGLVPCSGGNFKNYKVFNRMLIGEDNIIAQPITFSEYPTIVWVSVNMFSLNRGVGYLQIVTDDGKTMKTYYEGNDYFPIFVTSDMTIKLGNISRGNTVCATVTLFTPCEARAEIPASGIIINTDHQPLWLTTVARQQSGKVPRRKGGLRVPSKEASSSAIKQQRAKESDGIFATAIKGFGSRLAGTVGSVASAIGSVGNLLGWSKPILAHSGESALFRPVQYFGNDSGIDHSHVLGLNVDNNVDQYPGLAGTDLDECDFEFLKRIPNLFTYFNYDDTEFNPTSYDPLEKTLTGDCSDILAQWFVVPNYDQMSNYRITLQGSNLLQETQVMPTTTSYISSPFAYWTGSIVYTFRFVKTDFHSGRIEFSFHPFANHFVNLGCMKFLDNEALDRFDMAYRVVVDLRENSEVSITVPYVSPQPWKVLEYDRERFDPLIDSASYDSNAGYMHEKNYLNYTTGLFVVRKLTPLILSSAVVSKEITCLVEMRAGDDYKVSCPAHSVYFPFSFPKIDNGEPDFIEPLTLTDVTRDKSNVFHQIIDAAAKTPYDSQHERDKNEFVAVRGYAPSSEDETFYLYHQRYPDVKLYAEKPKTESSQIQTKIFETIDEFKKTAGRNPTQRERDYFNKFGKWRYDYPVTVAKEQAGMVFATPGTQDTRTRALEGFVPPSITGNDKDTERTDVSAYTAGEIFGNFRQFTRRFNFSHQEVPSVLPNFTYGRDGKGGVVVYSGNVPAAVILKPQDYILPPTLPVFQGKFNLPNADNEPATQVRYCIRPEISPTPLSFVGGMFCFYRGGMRFKVVATDNRTGQLILNRMMSARLIYHNTYDDTLANVDTVVATQTYPRVPKFISSTAFDLTEKKGFAEFQVPYYSPTLQSCAWNKQGFTLFDKPLPWVEVEGLRSDGIAHTLHIATAASDDLDFGLFLGPPPIIEYKTLRRTFTVYQDTAGGTTVEVTYKQFCMDRLAIADPCYEVNGNFSSWPPLANAIQWSKDKAYPTPDGLNPDDWVGGWYPYFSLPAFAPVKSKGNGVPYQARFPDLVFGVMAPPFKFSVISNTRRDLEIGLPAGSSTTG